MGGRKIEILVLLMAGLTPAVAGPFPAAYNVLCSTSTTSDPLPIVAQNITSVLGEPRPSIYTGLRFHQGTDIGDCHDKFRVAAIEGGVVQLPPQSACADESSDGTCLRIVNQATGHAFDYIHVVYDPSILGSTVATGALLGTIEVGAGHLHLNDVDLAGPFDQNTQHVNGLQFNDFGRQPIFVSAKGGKFALPALIPLPSYTAGEDGSNPNPRPFQLATDGSYIIPNKLASFDFLATVTDPINGLRRGVYSLQLTIAPVSDPFNFIYNGFSGAPNISFDSILDSNPNVQAQTIWLQQNAGDQTTGIPSSNTAFITNRKINFMPGIESADDNDVQTANLPPGKYEACATAVGFPNAPFINTAQTCTLLTVAASPFVTLTDSFDYLLYDDFSGVSDEIPSTLVSPVQNSPMRFEISDDFLDISSITVTGPLGGGVTGSITLTIDQGYDPANLPAGTRFISGSFSAKNLGVYTLTATDIGGQNTTTSFRVDTINVSLDTAAFVTSLNPTTGLLSGNLKLNITSSDKLDHAQVNSQGISPFSDFKDFSASGNSDVLNYTLQQQQSLTTQYDTLAATLVDQEGNSYFYEITLHPIDLGTFISVDPTQGTFNEAYFDGSLFITNQSGSYTSPIYTVDRLEGGLPGLLGPVLTTGIPLCGTSPCQDSPLPLKPSYSESVNSFGAPQVNPSTPFTSPLPIFPPFTPPFPPPGVTQYSPPQVSINIDFTTGNNPDLSDGVTTTIFNGNTGLAYQQLPSPWQPGQFDIFPALNYNPAQQIAYKQFYQFKETMTLFPPSIVSPYDFCEKGDAYICYQGLLASKGASPPSPGLVAFYADSVFGGPMSATDFDIGSNITSTLGLGFEISNFTATSQGTIKLVVGSPNMGGGVGQQLPPNLRTLPPNTIFELNPSGNFYAGSFTISFPYDSTGLSAAQQSALALVPVDPQGNIGAAINISNDIANHQITFNSTTFGRFMLTVPAFANPTIVSNGDFSITTSQSPGITVVPQDARSGALSSPIANLRSYGLGLVSQIYLVGPEGTSFQPSAAATMKYSAQQAAIFGASNFGLNLVQFSADGSYQILPNQFRAYQDSRISASVPRINSYFGVFASTNPTRDTIPPVTQRTFTFPPFFNNSGTAFMSGDDSIGFNAMDLPGPGSAASGVAFTQYRVDASTPGAPFQQFVSTFTLPEGAHIIEFRSQDNAGNLETTHALAISVDSTPPDSEIEAASATVNADGSAVVSSGTLIDIAAVDPVSNGVASGVADIFYVVDQDPFSDACSQVSFDPTQPLGTCANELYAGPFTLSLGTHTVYFAAVDNVGNFEDLNIASVTVTAGPIDALPPRTKLAIGTPSFGSSPIYLSSVSPLSLAAVDDLLTVGDGIGLGVAQTFLSIDSAPFAAISTPTFTLVAEGTHTLSYYSVDVVGNTEQMHVATVAVDNTTPMTQLSISSPSFTTAYGLVVSSQAVLSLAAVDPASRGTASGVKDTYVATTSSAFVLYGGTFTLTGTDGSKTVQYYSRDNVLNIELVKSTVIGLDDTPPITTLSVIGGRQFPVANAANFYVSSTTFFTFISTDPMVNGVASGVAFTQFQDCGNGPAGCAAPFQTVSSSFALSEGAHNLGYQSQDNVQNLEILRSTAILVDATPPVSTTTIGSPVFISTNGTVYIATFTPITFSAYDPSLPQTSSGPAVPGSGVNHIEVAVDTTVFTTFASTLTLAEGAHTILWRAVDNVGNVESIHTLTFQSDATPPLTSLTVSTPTYNGFVSSSTLFTLSAMDPVISGFASGVASTRYQINGSPFASSPLAFNLSGPDGTYSIAYQSQDNVGNMEVLRSTTVFLDQTPPVTTAHIGTPLFTATDGTNYVTPATPITFTAVDPASSAAASGVNRIEIAIDGGGFSPYAGALNFAEGKHIVQYRAIDNVGNVEATHTLTVQSDNTPPITTINPNSNFFLANGQTFASAGFNYAFSAQDPAANGVASGIASTQYRISVSTLFVTYGSTFSLAEGVQQINFQSQDNVGNLEVLRSTTIFVDATPPVTSLSLGQPQFAANGLVYVSTATQLVLISTDPASQGVASGVRSLSYRLDGAPAAAYGGPFMLAGADGLHAIADFGTDNVGNQEVLHVSTVALDATPPITTLALMGGRQFMGPNASAVYASSDTRFEFSAIDPIVNGVASGLALTRWQDNGGAFLAYISSFTLPEGSHALGYQSQDNVQNLEVLRSTTVWVDATPPVTTVSIGTPTFTATDGTVYVASATPVTFTSADPLLPTGQPGSGVNHVELAIDSGAFVASSSAVFLAEGRHTIFYRSVDNVGNVEIARSIQIQSDATPPVSTLSVGQPSIVVSSSVVLVSSRTLLSIAAVDPISNGVASGVRQTFYSVNGGTFTVIASSFTLSGPDGARAIAYFSVDNIGNVEGIKFSSVTLVTTAPQIALLSPSQACSGVCRTVKGRFPVLGTVLGSYLQSYLLDFAPGQNAAAGFVMIGSGTVAISSGTLGTWDASKLSGWQTLRLTATNLLQNVSVIAINVFVGDPGELMVLGNHDVFNMPQGVAVGSGSTNGNLYVADTNADRIVIVSSTATFLAAFGRSRDRDHDEDDVRSSTVPLRLNKPKGVAVDAAGAIYVADTNDDRVLKLSASGQVLLALGRRENIKEFNKPSGVAVNGAGSIYVADTLNSRVRVFSSTGAPLLAFSLPPVSADKDRDGKREQDRDSGIGDLGTPFGIAVDATGNIYTADPKGHRALEFDPTGRLMRTFFFSAFIGHPKDSNHDAHLVQGQPEGVAVTPDGQCLLVSDRKLGRIFKFDGLGDRTLAFGEPGKLRDDQAPPAQIEFLKPVGLALDAGGSLYVADRNNERIEKFGLPTGQPALVIPPPAPEDKLSARDVIDKDEGGQIVRDDGAAIQVPGGALSNDLKITVSTAMIVSAIDESNKQNAIQTKNLKTVSAPVEYNPEGTTFAQPVAITLPYDPKLASLQGVSEDNIKINYWNRGTAQWEAFDTIVDKDKHTVTAKTTHFSLYQVLSGTAAAAGTLDAGPAADPSFGLRSIYVFPNPAVAGKKPTFHIAVGVADSVTIKVFDIAGRPAHQATVNSPPTVIDDGSGPQYAYEYVWDGHIPSGVYLYYVQADKSGYGSVRKSGKLAVVR